jgi:di/tricarboxylate transporter
MKEAFSSFAGYAKAEAWLKAVSFVLVAFFLPIIWPLYTGGRYAR